MLGFIIFSRAVPIVALRISNAFDPRDLGPIVFGAARILPPNGAFVSGEAQIVSHLWGSRS